MKLDSSAMSCRLFRKVLRKKERERERERVYYLTQASLRLGRHPRALLKSCQQIE